MRSVRPTRSVARRSPLVQVRFVGGFWRITLKKVNPQNITSRLLRAARDSRINKSKGMTDCQPTDKTSARLSGERRSQPCAEFLSSWQEVWVFLRFS